MNLPKKLSLILLAAAVILAVGIYMVVSTGDKDVFVDLDSNEPVTGSWATEMAETAAEQADLVFAAPESYPEDPSMGSVSGSIAEIELTDAYYQKREDDAYVIFNRDGKKAFVVQVEGDRLTLESAATTYDASWELFRQ